MLQFSSSRQRRLYRIGLSALLWCGLASPAAAVLIDSGDGTGNTTAPADDPGFIHIGKRSQFSAVYVGNGWVLTANHTGVGAVEIDGTSYPDVAGSKVRFDDGGVAADLMAFQIDPYPALPILPINAIADLTGESVIMAGNGNDRGAAVTECSSIDGYAWSGSKSIRWGTNTVGSYITALSTNALVTTFDQGGSAHEAQNVNGDSGGALFFKNGTDWELAGILFALGAFGCQSPSTSLYGNQSYSVDLATYRSQIIATVRPECSDEVDNDGDGLIDFPDDPDCASLEGQSETTPGVPGLGPTGLTLLAATLLAGAVKSRRRA